VSLSAPLALNNISRHAKVPFKYPAIYLGATFTYAGYNILCRALNYEHRYESMLRRTAEGMENPHPELTKALKVTFNILSVCNPCHFNNFEQFLLHIKTFSTSWRKK
jgi:hypothetical protein